MAPYKRVVVKVGTSILTSKKGKFSKREVDRVSGEILDLLKLNYEVILVSSGAIACGMDVLGLKARPKELPDLQACAAIGQGKLMRNYEAYFSKRKFHTAQVLLTRDGIEDRERYLNARNTLMRLLAMKILPVVNENDTVTTEEIRFGDNDTLSVLVSSMIEADLLVILSDVDGVYSHDKKVLSEIHSVREIEQEIKPLVYQVKREQTTGGMAAKLSAARFAMQAGVPMLIANGHRPGILKQIIQGEKVGTLFVAEEKKRSHRKNWLAFAQSKGELTIDEGAEKALVNNGKSLLPKGIAQIQGKFGVGDVVRIMNAGGEELARGLVNYTQHELIQILGKRTDEIKTVLGYKYFDEVVHRDNLVITKGS